MRGDAFVAWMRRELQRREWTQADLSRKLNVPSGSVSRWMHGQRPQPYYCDLLADVFGADVDEVLTLAGHRPALLNDDPELAGLISLLRRVERTPERVTFLRSMLESMLEVQAASGAPRRRSRPAPPQRERLGA